MHHFRNWPTGIMILLTLATPGFTLNQMADAAPALRGSASVAVKVRPYKPVPSSKQANPRVPYSLSSGGKPVMIPQSLSDLLKSPTAALPESFDFLRRISLASNNFEAAGTPEPAGAQLKTATELLQRLQSNPNLFQHMETLRQGYIALPSREKNDLVVRLLSRYEAAPDNAASYFDYGYAQLLYLDNQTGLFFLRKANEQLNTSATALAYAMGQAQVDLNQDKAKPEEMTMRKLDVIHKLNDALAMDLSEHQAGFWPVFVQTLQKLKSFPAYQDVTKRDFSLNYVPQGNTLSYTQLQNYQPTPDAFSLAATALEKPVKGKAKKSKDASPQRIVPEPKVAPANEAHVIGIRQFPNRNQYIQFKQADDNGQVQVTVLDNLQHSTLCEFLTQGNMNVVEDLDKDGQYELVVRQYRERPLEPVRVYRWTGQAYELDAGIAQRFQ